MQLSEDLQIAVSVALSEARRRRHEFAGLEHLLQALALDAATAEVLRHAGRELLLGLAVLAEAIIVRA